jgi:hypothetical protein
LRPTEFIVRWMMAQCNYVRHRLHTSSQQHRNYTSVFQRVQETQMLIATVSAVPGMIVRPVKVTTTWASCLRLRTLCHWGCEGVDWIDLAQDGNMWRAVVNTVMNIWFPRNSGNSLSRWGTVYWWTGTPFHEFICLIYLFIYLRTCHTLQGYKNCSNKWRVYFSFTSSLNSVQYTSSSFLLTVGHPKQCVQSQQHNVR